MGPEHKFSPSEIDHMTHGPWNLGEALVANTMSASKVYVSVKISDAPGSHDGAYRAHLTSNTGHADASELEESSSG